MGADVGAGESKLVDADAVDCRAYFLEYFSQRDFDEFVSVMECEDWPFVRVVWVRSEPADDG